MQTCSNIQKFNKHYYTLSGQSVRTLAYSAHSVHCHLVHRLNTPQKHICSLKPYPNSSQSGITSPRLWAWWIMASSPRVKIRISGNHLYQASSGLFIFSLLWSRWRSQRGWRQWLWYLTCFGDELRPRLWCHLRVYGESAFGEIFHSIFCSFAFEGIFQSKVLKLKFSGKPSPWLTKYFVSFWPCPKAAWPCSCGCSPSPSSPIIWRLRVWPSSGKFPKFCWFGWFRSSNIAHQGNV